MPAGPRADRRRPCAAAGCAASTSPTSSRSRRSSSPARSCGSPARASAAPPGRAAPTARSCPCPRRQEGWHTWVEFGNRTLTFVARAARRGRARRGAWPTRAGGARSGLPRAPRADGLALVPVLGTVAQAVLGGITVLTGLSPLIVGAHFLLSMGLVALVTDARPARRRARRRTEAGRRRAAPSASGVHVPRRRDGRRGRHRGRAGTSSGPARRRRADASPRSRPADGAWLHADLVLLALGLHDRPARGAARHAARRCDVGHAAMVDAAARARPGRASATCSTSPGCPWLLVAVHVLGAVLVWWSTVRLLLSTVRRGVPVAALTRRRSCDGSSSPACPAPGKSSALRGLAGLGHRTVETDHGRLERVAAGPAPAGSTGRGTRTSMAALLAEPLPARARALRGRDRVQPGPVLRPLRRGGAPRARRSR